VFVKSKKIFSVLFFILLFLLPLATRAISCSDDQNGKTEQQLLAIEAQCNLEIADLTSKSDVTKQYSSALQNGIADLNYKITKIQLEIKAKNAAIKQLGDNIVVKNKYIGQLSNRMDDIKKTIGKMLRDSYSLDNQSVTSMLLSSDNLSNYFINVDNYSTINQKLQTLIQELTGVKQTSEQEKKNLEAKQAQESKLKYEQEQAKTTTQSLKTEQQTLLSLTQNKEAEYQQMITEKEKLKNQIRNKLYKTASGEEISFGDALKLIQPYESTIGVNSALILAVLFQESAVDSTIGKNIGQCTYNQVSSCGAGKNVMSNTQVPSFLSLANSLGLNANTTPVSCPICSDGNYGGAMGPAQFMPVTWNGISSRVGSIIGASCPSPFKNLDAFVASGVLLKDNQDRCEAAFTKKTDIWACAASKYYGGLNLKGSKLSSFMYRGYGASVLTRALQFEKDIATLSL
jgi:peptidoglycan hydrolase CwlO-like protein